MRMTKKTEDSLYFGWEGRSRPIFQKNFHFCALRSRSCVFIHFAALLSASSPRLRLSMPRKEVLLAMKHSEPFLFQNTCYFFVLNDQYLAKSCIFAPLTCSSKIKNSQLKEFHILTLYNIAATATSKSRRRNRTLPSVIWRGLSLSPSMKLQMNL